MPESPLITIALPVYNSKRHVRQSLESLLAQTYKDFVLIISDNASTDGTADICQEYAKSDSRIQYTRNPANIGNPGNFNRLVGLTTTKYIKWATSDDFWEPTFVERALEVIDKDPTIALCYPKSYVVDGEGKNATPYEDNLHLMQDDPAERFIGLLENIGLAHQHLGVIRTDMLRCTGLLGPYFASDITLLAELTLYGKYYELPERLFYRRFHETSGSWKRGDKQHQDKFYHAADRKRTGLPRWRGELGRLRAVARSPLPLKSKLHLHRYQLRHMRWSRDLLFGELVGYARSVAR
jgi:glycosyltransferase involved in cell wall biosynthesis